MDTVDEAGKRRKTRRVMRSLAEKHTIVEEAMRPGASVAAVARRHGLNANLLFGWRRLYEQGLLSSRTRASALVPVVMSIPASTDDTASAPTSALIAPAAAVAVVEVELPNGTRFWIRGAADVPLVSAVCLALSGQC